MQVLALSLRIAERFNSFRSHNVRIWVTLSTQPSILKHISPFAA